MDTMHLVLKKIAREMISEHTDTINRYESGEDIPEELYKMAQESLPEWKKQLSIIEEIWPS